MEGYQYCECARQYLRERFSTCRKDEKDIAAAIGYSDFEKFRRHQDAWHALERPIPRKYLGAIGADVEILCGALERDQVNFQLVEAVPRSAHAYSIRFAPAEYSVRFFNEAIPEDEAVRRVKAVSAELGVSCLIEHYQIMKIDIEPDGSIRKRCYRPAMKVTSNWVAFEHYGSQVGTMRMW